MTPARPRLLFLGQTLPFPPDGGVHIRMYHVLRLLSRAFDITALCFYRRRERQGEHSVRAAIEGLAPFARVEAFPIPQEFSRPRLLWDHLRSTLRQRAYTWFTYASGSMVGRIRELRCTQRFDIAQIDSLDLAACLPHLEGIPVVCVHHNVESALLRRRAAIDEHPLRSAYLGFQAALLERLETEWCGRVALNVCVSREDVATLHRLAPDAPYAVVPNGADVDRFRPGPPPTEPLVLGVGGINWGPNREGLDFFCTTILPHIRRDHPAAQMAWVGRASEEERREYRERYGVELTGYVDDVRPWLARAACVVVPLRSGGGTRLKILDAWATAKGVVATSVGAEGLAVDDGVNIMIRDDPRAFAAAVGQLLDDPAARAALGAGGRRTAEEVYAWEAVGAAMIERYRELLGEGAPLALAG